MPFRIRVSRDYALYLAICPTCSKRRGWRTRSAAHTAALDHGEAPEHVEFYEAGAEDTCACALDAPPPLDNPANP